MKKKAQQLFKLEFVRVTAVTGVSNLIRIAGSFISAKVLAVIVGPVGVALLGQFASGSALIYAFATLSFNVGIVKLVAEAGQKDKQRNLVISSAFKLTVISSVIVSLLVFFLATYISVYLLKTEEYAIAIQTVAVTVLFYSINQFMLSVTNALQLYGKFNLINISSSLITLFSSVLMIYFYRIYGSLLAVSLAQIVILFSTILILKKQSWFSGLNLRTGIDKKTLYQLGTYSLMSFLSMFFGTMGQLQVRNQIIEHCEPGLINAGIWEGLNKISAAFVMIASTSMGISYLPKMAGFKTSAEIHKELLLVYKIIIPFILVVSLLIYLFKGTLISILYSPQFDSMQPLFLYQLIGDILKICSWLVAYLMLARSFVKSYILFEACYFLIWLLANYFMVTNLGIMGAPIAYMCINFLYLVSCLLFYRNKIYGKIDG